MRASSRFRTSAVALRATLNGRSPTRTTTLQCTVMFLSRWARERPRRRPPTYHNFKSRIFLLLLLFFLVKIHRRSESGRYHRVAQTFLMTNQSSLLCGNDLLARNGPRKSKIEFRILEFFNHLSDAEFCGEQLFGWRRYSKTTKTGRKTRITDFSV